MKINDFRYWCHKVLPLVYDESLSYYEVLCKLTQYIQTVIETLDDTSAEIEELNRLLVELREYVDHYFDDLDIQQQIDDKLDEMAANGTLASLIVNYFNMYVTPESYGAKGDGETDDTAAIQQAIDTGKNVLFSKTTYLVSKATNAEIYPNHDEPCLYIYHKNGQTINGNGATLKVDAHGQGIIEVKDSDFITIRDLNLQGYGSFPKLDTSSGRGEKGTTGEGYYDTQHHYEFGKYKNNSVDTSGYRGFANDETEIWGTFGNGYIGNCGSGILIYDGSTDVTIDNCKITGFNYAGVQTGSRTEESVTRNSRVTVKNCTISTCYNAAIDLEAVVRGIADGNNISNIGHPDAFPSGNTYEYTYADPGYGIVGTFADSTIPYDLIITNNIINNVIRKGVDLHTGQEAIISNNIIRAAWAYAIQCEEVANVGGLRRVIITDNIIRGGCQRGGAISVLSNNETKTARFVNIEGNQCSDCDLGSVGTLIFVRYFSSAVIANNNMLSVNVRSGIVVAATDQASITGNTVRVTGAADAYPLQIESCDGVNCSGNLFDIADASIVYRVANNNTLMFCNNMFRANTISKVLSSNNGITYNNVIYDRNNNYQAGASLFEYSDLNAISISESGDTFTAPYDCVISISTNPTTGSASYLTIVGNDDLGCVYSGYSETGVRVGGNAFLRGGVTYTFTFENIGTPAIKYFTVVNKR